MRRIILLALLLCGSFWAMSEATAGEQARLWYTSSLDDGGALKTSMIERGQATEESVSLGALVMDAWLIAERRGVRVEVSTELQPAFSMQLFELFLRRHDLSGTPDSMLTWEEFGEIGRLHSGYAPFTQADAEQALKQVHEITHGQPSPQLVAPVEQPLTQPVLVAPVGPTPSAPTVTVSRPSVPLVSPEEQSEPTTPTTYRQPTIRQYTPLRIEQFTGPMEAPVQPIEWGSEPTTRSEMLRLTPTSDNGLRQPQQQVVRQASIRSHTEAFLRSYFHDIPVMVEIARCESDFQNVQSRLRQPYGRERSFGFFQIHEPDWHDDAVRLGLNEYQTDAMQNLLMARHVYNTQGLDAWRASRHCWGRYHSRY